MIPPPPEKRHRRGRCSVFSAVGRVKPLWACSIKIRINFTPYQRSCFKILINIPRKLWKLRWNLSGWDKRSDENRSKMRNKRKPALRCALMACQRSKAEIDTSGRGPGSVCDGSGLALGKIHSEIPEFLSEFQSLGQSFRVASWVLKFMSEFQN